MNGLSQWRTVGVVGFLALVLLACVALLRDKGQAGAEMLDHAAWGLVALAGVVGFKSAAQHLGTGAGVKGAVRALFTDAKPPEAKP